ncbi:hypothetical protein OESDEN_10363 [Oesophagostomum dentatum]|uniref:Uncharacterized protein n=1 Tax=Oesophagostomum dentatum TaxID=61180 RepID=A0A0B1SWX2_OESDE|nr:hypothetical protein OESDEN_10363 [Oesophagostomum dentatum]
MWAQHKFAPAAPLTLSFAIRNARHSSNQKTWEKAKKALKELFRRIEEFLDPTAEIIFYDRFWNPEVMAGGYLVKNSHWAQGTGWARDIYLANSVWSPDRDFMMHDMKSQHLEDYEFVPVE